MDNARTAEYLARIYTPALRNIFLCHLSGDNNHPELAYKTVENRLYEEGIRVGKDVELVALTVITRRSFIRLKSRKEWIGTVRFREKMTVLDSRIVCRSVKNSGCEKFF